MRYRVFCRGDVAPEPAALLEHLHGLGLPVRGHFHGDDQGWFRAELVPDADAAPLELERYLAEEEGIRAELNTWAAWLETAEGNPHAGRLMQHVIATRQVFTLQSSPDDEDPPPEEVCLAVCRFLASAADGVFQGDGRGFCAADGAVLVPE
jgi:hypothetical protein